MQPRPECARGSEWDCGQASRAEASTVPSSREWETYSARTMRALASAATPSARPVTPRRSEVVADTVTVPPDARASQDHRGVKAVTPSS